MRRLIKRGRGRKELIKYSVRFSFVSQNFRFFPVVYSFFIYRFMIDLELGTKSASVMPKYLYHLVPEKLFAKFFYNGKYYDCRNQKEWGKDSPFIHASPAKKQLKERVADLNWAAYPAKEKFLLLEINPRTIKARIAKAIINGYPYYHVWGQLPKESFKILQVKRSQDGKFLI